MTTHHADDATIVYIAQLEQENAELRKDAERYRWLRNDDNWGDDADHRWEVLGEKSCKDFDALIDATMGAKK